MSRDRRSAGFALVTAIFVLVALAGAASALLSLAGDQRSAATTSLETARAYQAARSGVEWAALHALRSHACPADTSFTLSEGGLRGFAVSVECASSQHTDGAAPENVFLIHSSAERGSFGAAGYVRRRVSATFSDAP